MTPARALAAVGGFLLLAVVTLLVLAFTVLTAVATAIGAVAAGGTGPVCGAAGTGLQVDGVDLDADQLGIAHVIVTAVAARGLPARAAVIAVATALQESRLTNLPGGDADSVGVFQQRLTYYPATVASDPARATAAFLDRLVAVPGWQTLPVTVAAQTVQLSAHPGAYAQWQPLAEQVVGRLWPTATTTDSSRSTGSGLCPDTPAVAPSALTGSGGQECVSPLPGARITSGYGWRIHPVIGTRQLHAGVDLAGGPTGGAGAPIRAACAGVVATAGAAAGYGNYIQIQHAGFVTGYGHMSVLAVHPGDHVAAGQVIAYVGCAGTCTGPHLHFDVRPTLWGTTSDPVAFFAHRGLEIG